MCIANRQSISQSYLEQLFTQLRQKKLVKSVRGPGGGYLIDGDLENITVAHIIQAVDHKTEKHHVGNTTYHKHGKDASLMQLLWNELSLHTYRFLNGVTLKSLVEQIK